MIPVILVGSEDNSGISVYLRQLLQRSGGVFSVSKRAVSGGPQSRFLLLEYDRVPQLGLAGGILIFKRGSAGDSRFPSPGGLTGVVDSAHTGALSLLKESGIPAISCGMSARDTLTLSSVGENSATVTLSRALKTLSGGTAEPQDIPVSLAAPADGYSIMAGAAVLLLAE